MRIEDFDARRVPVRSVLATAALLSLGLLSTGAFALGGLAGMPPTPPAVTKPSLTKDPRTVDLGVASATAVRSVTVTLSVRNQAALDTFVASLSNPASANYRKFITPAQFAASYGQTAAAVAQVVAYLQSQGLSTKVHANNLGITATGSNAQLAAAFGTTIHSYSLNGTTFQAATTKAAIPAALTGIVRGVSGLSTYPAFRSHAARIPNTGALAGDVPVVTKAATLPTSAPVA